MHHAASMQFPRAYATAFVSAMNVELATMGNSGVNDLQHDIVEGDEVAQVMKMYGAWNIQKVYPNNHKGRLKQLKHQESAAFWQKGSGDTQSQERRKTGLFEDLRNMVPSWPHRSTAST